MNISNNQLNFSFQTYKSLADKTYFLESSKYLCCSMRRINFIIDKPFLHLLVSDDNSILANSIRNNEKNECFTIPFSDLKFQPNFFKKENDDWDFDAFLVKNTNQIKKITEKEIQSPQTITFKVKSQKKFRKEKWVPGTYQHELEIEPFSLGMEEYPEISRITFDFGYGQSLESTPNSLMKTWLYNHKILSESAGKTFSMKVNWLMKGENYKELLFSDSNSFEVDNFKEKSFENNPPPSQEDPQNTSQQKSPVKKIFLIVGIIAILTLIIFIICYYWKKSCPWPKKS